MLHTKRCFNPWFVGRLIQREAEIDEVREYLKFQSLVCWTINSKIITAESLPTLDECFNPWFVGRLIQSSIQEIALE